MMWWDAVALPCSRPRKPSEHASNAVPPQARRIVSIMFIRMYLSCPEEPRHASEKRVRGARHVGVLDWSHNLPRLLRRLQLSPLSTAYHTHLHLNGHSCRRTSGLRKRMVEGLFMAHVKDRTCTILVGCC